MTLDDGNFKRCESNGRVPTVSLQNFWEIIQLMFYCLQRLMWMTAKKAKDVFWQGCDENRPTCRSRYLETRMAPWRYMCFVSAIPMDVIFHDMRMWLINCGDTSRAFENLSFRFKVLPYAYWDWGWKTQSDYKTYLK